MSTSLMFENPRAFLRNELRNMLQGGDPFGASSWSPSSRPFAGVFPLVNIYDNGEGFLVRAEMPGVDKDSLDVSCKNDQVVIRGERVLEAVGEDANYHRHERDAGKFRRALTLPQAIDPKKVKAEYKNGILEIYTPRAEEAKGRKITVK